MIDRTEEIEKTPKAVKEEIQIEKGSGGKWRMKHSKKEQKKKERM